MTATLDPVRQQREILATFRRISLQRAQAEADAVARFTQENDAAEAAIASAREDEEMQRLAAEQAAFEARNVDYAAAEERYAQQLRDGETGVAAAQKHWEGALTVLGLADMRHMLTEARTVPVRLQPGQEPAQELKRCAGEAAAAAARLEATVDGIMAMRVEKQHSTAKQRRRAPFVVVLVAFVLFLGYVGTRPCGVVSGLTGGGASCSATLHGASGPVEAVAYSSDGKTIAAAAADGTVHLWSFSSHNALRTLRGSAAPLATLAFVAGGKSVAAAGDDGVIYLWDTASGRALPSLPAGAPVRSLAASADGKTLAAGRDDGSLTLSNVATGAAISATTTSSGAIRALAFAPDGKSLASAGDDGVVRLWNTSDGAAAGTLDAHAGPVLALAFAPDGGTLAAGGAGGSVPLWNPQSGAQLRSFNGAGGVVRGIAFSHDGARLIAAGDGAGARIWDAKSGRTLTVINAGTALHGVATSPTSTMLVLAGDDHSVLLRQDK